MIIDSIKIKNFGLYKGENLIQLSPNILNSKNITVISGQNGVGKSTLLEAIHLCLLGSLSIDERLSESNYEKHLLKRVYSGLDGKIEAGIELTIDFIKSGEVIKYKISRNWCNGLSIDESVSIEENGKELTGLSKKEKNMFLRELIQPGLAKVMFFDGEKLQSLYDEKNLSSFIAESCRYLFGLNFIDLLNADLNYYINKLYSQQDASHILDEIKKVKEELEKAHAEIVTLEDEKSSITNNLKQLKKSSAELEKQISDQGRWTANTLEKLKSERQEIESNILNLKKELIEIYSALGPFVFCKNLLISLKDRLLVERDIDNWLHAKELLCQKLADVEEKLHSTNFLKSLSLDADVGRKLYPALQNILLSSPKLFEDDGRIYHEMADKERLLLISWIDDIMNNISVDVKRKSGAIDKYESRLKEMNKEQSSFSKDDLIAPLLKQIQEVSKQIGSEDQRLTTLNRKSEEANKRRDFYSNRLTVLEERMRSDSNVDEKLKLSSKTKLVLESYGQRLLSQKLNLLKKNVLDKFNLLCRKESYLDDLSIDSNTFDISLSRGMKPVEHTHLSAGEKQLLIISFLWGLRELTNIALPLIIDTPLARLDIEHRKAFVEEFLPAIQPQVILIGTDMELSVDVVNSLSQHTSRHYLLEYDKIQQATKLIENEIISRERIEHEI